MPLSEAELKKREELLKRDQIDWIARRDQLERKLVHDNILLDTLGKKVATKKKLVDELEANLADLSTSRRTVQHEIDNLEESRRLSDRKAETAKQILTDLDAVIESKRARVDNDMAAYREARRTEIEQGLRDTQNRLDTAQEQLLAAGQQLEVYRTDLETVRQNLVLARADTETAQAVHEAQATKLRAEIASIETTLGTLSGELSKLLYRRDKVTADIAKIETDHKNFLDYETRARKLLDTKDRQLQEKALELAQVGRHIKPSRSFLSEL